MAGLALHYYTRVGKPRLSNSATEFGEGEWFWILKHALFIEELVKRHATIMDRYDPEGRVALVVDEWGTWYDVEPGTNPGFLYQQNTLRDALVAGVTLNVFNRHCDRVQMANIAQTVNVLQAMVLTHEDRMVLTPTYHVYEMYKHHQGGTLLPIDLRSETYDFSAGEAGSIPAISASASRDQDGRIHLSLCNLAPNREAEITCTVRGDEVTAATGRVLTAGAMHAHNTFERPDAVRPAPFEGARLAAGALLAVLPPKSVVMIELS
jgi:alpha-N-arabinofuranosidase